jgi:hypothetical protein
MSVKKYEPGMILVPGQWVNLESNLRHGISGQPYRIESVLSSSVRLEFSERDGSGCFIKRNTSILWVCDYEEESVLFFLLSKKFSKAAFDIEKELLAGIEKMRSEVVEFAIGECEKISVYKLQIGNKE